MPQKGRFLFRYELLYCTVSGRVKKAPWNARICGKRAPVRGPGGETVPHAYKVDRKRNETCLTLIDARAYVSCNESTSPVGTHLAGELCHDCRPCVSRGTDFRFVTCGALDRNDSCTQRCMNGTFEELGLGI